MLGIWRRGYPGPFWLLIRFGLRLFAHQHAPHTIRGKETIIDAGTQGVGVDWLAKIGIRLHSLSAQRCSRHADLDSALEIFQDRTPARIILRAAPVTFIHDDHIEEVAWEVMIQ